MSTEPPGLGDWIVALMANLAACDVVAYARLQGVIGARRARIELGEEAVVVRMVQGRLEILQGDVEPVDGVGATDRGAVLAMLDGRLEATDALRTGQVRATGDVEALTRIFHAIELLLDVSSRCPPLRTLAASFRESGPPTPLRSAPEPSWVAEQTVLARLGLLDD